VKHGIRQAHQAQILNLEQCALRIPRIEHDGIGFRKKLWTRAAYILVVIEEKKYREGKKNYTGSRPSGLRA